MTAESEAPVRRERDPRLDFFRGLGMLIILVAHVPWNPWTNFIPARYGFSDAAEMFVFCSGMASALAFGRVFDQHGWTMGAQRIALRIWQVYWAHICSFLVVLAFAIAVDQWLGVDHYVREELNLQSVLDHPRTHLVGLLTLRYVPNYFDILPMYLVVLAMVCIVMALATIHRGLVAVFVLACWTGAQFGWLHFVADGDEGRDWFFNPFAWQIVFFLGFSFAKGWLPAPPRDRRLVLAAIAIVVLSAPFSCSEEFSCHAGFGFAPVLGDIRAALGDLISKSDEGPLRTIHFLATAYLAFVAAGPRGSHLQGWWVEALRRIGQQTLAVFLTGLVVAQALGVALDLTGRNFLPAAVANIGGFVLLYGAGRLVSHMKSAPWKRPAAHRVKPAAPAISDGQRSVS